MIEFDEKEVGGVRLSVSIVSHNQVEDVSHLLQGLQNYCTDHDEVIVTLNSKGEQISLDDFSFNCPVRVVHNKLPLGFGANHNQAFALSKGKYFCVVNPDIRLLQDPFRGLLKQVNSDSKVGVVAPIVINSSGVTERSARDFPTPIAILKKALLGEREVAEEVESNPDWVAGMFMVFPTDVFLKLQGFNERFFLYYEDVDICARLRLAGYSVILCPNVSVQHDAQRKSHSDPIFRRYHLESMMKFFFSSPFCKMAIKKITSKLYFF